MKKGSEGVLTSEGMSYERDGILLHGHEARCVLVGVCEKGSDKVRRKGKTEGH